MGLYNTSGELKLALEYADGNVYPIADKLNINTTAYSAWSAALAALSAGQQLLVGEGTFGGAGGTTIAVAASILGTGMDVSILENSTSVWGARINSNVDLRELTLRSSYASDLQYGGLVYGGSLKAHRVKFEVTAASIEDKYGLEVVNGTDVILSQCVINGGTGGVVDGLEALDASTVYAEETNITGEDLSVGVFDGASVSLYRCNLYTGKAYVNGYTATTTLQLYDCNVFANVESAYTSATTTLMIFGGAVIGNVTCGASTGVYLFGPQIWGAVTGTFAGWYTDANGKIVVGTALKIGGNDITDLLISSDSLSSGTPDTALLSAKMVYDRQHKLTPLDGSPDPAVYVDAVGTLLNPAYTTGNRLIWFKNPTPSSLLYGDSHFGAYSNAITARPAYSLYDVYNGSATAIYNTGYQAHTTLRVISADNRQWPIAEHGGVGCYLNYGATFGAGVWTTITYNAWVHSAQNGYPCAWDGGTAIYGYAAGWYLVSAGAYISAGTVGGCRFLINGAWTGNHSGQLQVRQSVTTQGQGLVFTHQLYLTAGQYVQVQYYSSHASPAIGPDDWFQMLYLGE